MWTCPHDHSSRADVSAGTRAGCCPVKDSGTPSLLLTADSTPPDAWYSPDGIGMSTDDASSVEAWPATSTSDPRAVNKRRRRRERHLVKGEATRGAAARARARARAQARAPVCCSAMDGCADRAGRIGAEGNRRGAQDLPDESGIGNGGPTLARHFLRGKKGSRRKHVRYCYDSSNILLNFQYFLLPVALHVVHSARRARCTAIADRRTAS